MPITHKYRLIGSILAFSAVLFGAFGAHALKETLSAHDSIQTWETAVRYQMWHALALILLSMISLSNPIPKMTGPCFVGRDLTILRLTLRTGTRWAKMARSGDTARWTMPDDRMVATCLFELQK